MNKFTLISMLIFLSGCLNNEESAVKKAVLNGLKDPESAKFGKFKLIDDERACITVNAKNAFGGYTGDQQAFVMKKSGSWFFLTTGDISQDKCAEIIKSEGKL
jgi:hypothetical protein